MSPELYVRRLVLPESQRELRFRHRVEREFGHTALSIVDTNNLHTTIARIPSDTQGLEATARHLLDQPDSSASKIRANVVDARPFGYNRVTGIASFGLAIDHPALDDDRDHFMDITTGPYRNTYTPHVTLFRAHHVEPHDVHRITEWVEALAPAQIALSAVAATTVRRRMQRLPIRERQSPREVQLQ